jgi:hypothetical protein
MAAKKKATAALTADPARRYRVIASAHGRWPRGSEVSGGELGNEARVKTLIARKVIVPVDVEGDAGPAAEAAIEAAAQLPPQEL